MGIDGPFRVVGTPLDPLSPVSAMARNQIVPTRWPPGFTATFSPELVVWSPDGTALIRGGQDMTAGSWGRLFVCGTTQRIDVFAAS